MFCSFQCRSLALLLFILFLSILTFFDAIINKIVFLISFLDFPLLVYRNTVDFYILILGVASLLNSYFSSNHFIVNFLGFSMCMITPSAKRDSLTSSFLIWMPFISFSCLIALARSFSALLRVSRVNRHPCVAPDLRGKAAGFSQFNYDINCDFDRWPFRLRKFPSVPSLFSFSDVFFYAC